MLELTGDHIARLNDEDLRTLVTKLATAELRRLRLPQSAVLAGGNQRASDGGLDVVVELPETPTVALDFIPRQLTGFQVKCEDIPSRKIQAEMRPHGNLRASIKDLIERGGAYVIVSSQGSAAHAPLQRRKKAMRDAVASEDPGTQLALDFYDRSRLAAWTQTYPGVEMWLRERVGISLREWRPYGNWTSDVGPYLFDQVARLRHRGSSPTAPLLSMVDGIDALRQRLQAPGGIIRLIGLSGTGKTRLVQALFEPGVGTEPPLDSAIAVYTDLGHDPDPSVRDMLTHLGANELRAIVIVDNCNPEAHRAYAGVAKAFARFLSVITVEYDVAEDETEQVEVFELVSASNEVLSHILTRFAPQVGMTDRGRIVEFSGGNARVALALANTLSYGETLGVLKEASLFQRLFSQSQAGNAALEHAAEACALLYSFHSGSDSEEMQALASLAGCHEREFFRHVQTLIARDLVQKRADWRALLPHALANRLAKSALRNIPSHVIEAAFRPYPRMLRSFSRRLSYLHDSKEACAMVSEWITEGNWLAHPEELDEDQSAIFLNVAPLVPDRVLTALEHTVRELAGGQFAKVHRHTLQKWITLTRNLAYEAVNFERAASLVLNFAMVSSEERSQARDAWQELFHIVLSGTHATPIQRAEFLRNLLCTGKPDMIEWAAEGALAMLQAWHFTSSHQFSFGARPRSFGWEPDSAADTLQWYEIALALVTEMARDHKGIQLRVMNGLASHFRQLWSHAQLREPLERTMIELADLGGWHEGWSAVRLTRKFDAKSMDVDALAVLNDVAARLTPVTPKARILAYVLAKAYGGLNLADAEGPDDEPETTSVLNSSSRMAEIVQRLGEEAGRNPALLDEVLVPLMSNQQGRQHDFGIGVGRSCSDAMTTWKTIYAAYVSFDDAERNLSLLGGFIQGARELHAHAANTILDAAITDAELAPVFALLQGWPWDDAGGDRLLQAITHGRVYARHIRLVAHRPDGTGLTVKKYCEVSRALAGMNMGLETALESIWMEYYRHQNAKLEINAELIRLGRELMCQFDFNDSNTSLPYHMAEISKICFVGSEAVQSTLTFIGRFTTALDNGGAYLDGYGALAVELFKIQAETCLDTFLLSGDETLRPFRLRFVTRHGSVVEHAGIDAIGKWIAVEADVRAPLVAAEIIPLAGSASEGFRLSDIAHLLLDAVSDKDLILNALTEYFHPSGWSGSLEETLQPQLGLAAFLSRDKDPKIAAWARRIQTAMKNRIIAEGERFRRSEQAFE